MQAMNTPLFQFGERLPQYEVPVLNERAVRAAAGLLFLPAIVAFLLAWLTGNFQPTRVFVVAFLLDFTLRLFVNPRYAPSLVIGQWIVRRQQPEWVGAPQKRFAWAIGFVLAAVMLYLVVIQQVVGPVNLFVCLACLTLLFFESAFGICLGCRLYKLFFPAQARLCPGGVCEPDAALAARPGAAQLAVVAVFALLVGAVAQWTGGSAAPAGAAAPPAATAPAAAVDPAAAERCKVPEFAKRIGHEDMWKLHNNCK
jgi:hypothetical protein